mgnify:CR=1 FL=1
MFAESIKTNLPTELLRTLVTVCEFRSVTKAAQLLQLTQPAVTSADQEAGNHHRQRNHRPSIGRRKSYRDRVRDFEIGPAVVVDQRQDHF